MGGQVGKIGDGYGEVVDLAADLPVFLVWALQKFIEDPEFIHQFESRGMDGIAAKVAQKVGVLFKNDDLDAAAGQQEPEDHSRGTASGDAALGIHLLYGTYDGDGLGKNPCSRLSRDSSLR